EGRGRRWSGDRPAVARRESPRHRNDPCRTETPQSQSFRWRSRRDRTSSATKPTSETNSRPRPDWSSEYSPQTVSPESSSIFIFLSPPRIDWDGWPGRLPLRASSEHILIVLAL